MAPPPRQRHFVTHSSLLTFDVRSSTSFSSRVYPPPPPLDAPLLPPSAAAAGAACDGVGRLPVVAFGLLRPGVGLFLAATGASFLPRATWIASAAWT